jgi:hypothetical protein
MYERGLTFKQAVNHAIRSSSGHRNPKRAFRTRTFDMGEPVIPLDNALRLAGQIEDEELIRKIAARK